MKWLGCVPVRARAAAAVTIVSVPRRSSIAGRPGRAAVPVVGVVHVAATCSGCARGAGRAASGITRGHVVVAHAGGSSRPGCVGSGRRSGRRCVSGVHVVCVTGVGRVASAGRPKDADGDQGQES